MLRRKIDTELYRWRGSHSHGPLIIAGARRVGKTTTVRELGKLYEHFVELDLERYANHRAMLADSPDPLTLIARIRDEYGRDSVVKGRTLILLDEIIACPGVWATLEKLVGFRDCDVIATASLPGMVRGRVPDGVGYMEMGPLDFEEFLWARGISEAIIADAVWRIRARRPLDDIQMENAGKQMREYIAVGGMPQAVNEYIVTHSIDDVHRVHGEMNSVFRGIAGIYADPGIRERIYECFESVPEQLASGGGRFFFSKIQTHDGRKSSYGAREYGPAIRWLTDAGFCIRCDVTEHRNSQLHVPEDGHARDPGSVLSGERDPRRREHARLHGRQIRRWDAPLPQEVHRGGLPHIPRERPRRHRHKIGEQPQVQGPRDAALRGEDRPRREVLGR